MPEKQCRNAIILYDKDTDGKDISVGAGKMGGFPDLPPKIEYPVMSGFTEWKNNGKPYHYEKSAMQLVAQINLYELAESSADVENLLPKTGMLYIFWSGEIIRQLKSDMNHRIKVDDPDNTATYKVIYWDGDMSTLKRTAPSCSYNSRHFSDDECFTEFAVEFFDEEECKDNKKIMVGDKLFGFPQSLNPPHISKDKVLLFQFECGDYFGGSMMTFWTMKKEDLKNLDFSRTSFDFDIEEEVFRLV